eukprot:1157324-Pelagomonas_calceolata.AAC.2
MKSTSGVNNSRTSLDGIASGLKMLVFQPFAYPGPNSACHSNEDDVQCDLVASFGFLKLQVNVPVLRRALSRIYPGPLSFLMAESTSAQMRALPEERGG